MRLSLVTASLLLAVSATAPLQAADKPPTVKPAARVDGRRVAAIFRKYCTVCHNAEEAEGELVLETHDGLLKGGKNGKVIVPGKADASLLVELIEKRNKPFMPPKDNRGPRSSEIALIKAWINAGAKPPGGGGAAPLLTVPRVPTVGPVRQPVNSVAMSPDGRWFALARTDRIDLVVQPGAKPVVTITGLPGQVADIDFSGDGRYLAAAAGVPGLFGEARLYAVTLDKDGSARAKLVRSFRGHRDSLNATALSTDGGQLATAGHDRTIVVWDVATGNRRLELKGHNGPVFDLAFDPRGRFLVSASGDRTVKLWDLKTGKRLDTLTEPTKGQHAVAVSPDGEMIVAGGVDNRIRAWQVTGNGREGTNPIRYARFAHQAPLLDLAFSADGRFLASSSEDLSVKTWSTTGYVQLAEFPGQSDWPSSVAFTLSNRGVLVGRLDGTSEVLAIGDGGRNANPAVPLAGLPVPRPSGGPAPEKLPEIAEAEPNDVPAKATLLPIPGVATGVLAAPPTGRTTADADLFRFSAKKGENWVIQTRARRDKSPADTRIEVLDGDGRPVLRLLLRAVRDSAITFRPISSRQDQARLENWEEMKLNQFLYMNGEVVKNFRMPRGPDSGMQFYTINGQRRCYFDTSGTSHALLDKVYIVDPHRPGTRFPDNGLPVFPLYFANDDDGQRKLGSDSQLTFTAPADGDYLVRVTDVRGFGGDDFKYRLVIRQPRPDFKVTIGGKAATIPAGSGQRFTVKLDRLDGFSGPLTVEVTNLPPGFTATSPIVVEAGHREARGVITATADAKPAAKEAWDKVALTATAIVLGKKITRKLGNLGELKLGKPPKVLVTLSPDQPPQQPQQPQQPAEAGPELVIAPGETITAMLRITRNGFKGELRFDVDNLPHGVIVDNIGLSGIMVREGETERQIFLTAADWVPESQRLIHAVAQKEGRQASRPIRFVVRSPRRAARQ